MTADFTVQEFNAENRFPLHYIIFSDIPSQIYLCSEICLVKSEMYLHTHQNVLSLNVYTQRIERDTHNNQTIFASVATNNYYTKLIEVNL